MVTGLERWVREVVTGLYHSNGVQLVALASPDSVRFGFGN